MCTHVHTHTHAYFITITRTWAHYARFYVASQSMLLPNHVTLLSSVLLLPLCHYCPLICRRRIRWVLPLNFSVRWMTDRRYFQLPSCHNLLPPPKTASTTITQSHNHTITMTIAVAAFTVPMVTAPPSSRFGCC